MWSFSLSFFHIFLLSNLTSNPAKSCALPGTAKDLPTATSATAHGSEDGWCQQGHRPYKEGFLEKKPELSQFMQGKDVCLQYLAKERPVILHSRPSTTQSPFLYWVSAALRDALSCNSHHRKQLQSQQNATNAKKSLENCDPMWLIALVTGHRRRRQENGKQGIAVKMRSCGVTVHCKVLPSALKDFPRRV